MEIETGYGVEEILPNARVGKIIQQEITPRLKQGDYNGGTLAGTKALVTALEGELYSNRQGLKEVGEFLKPLIRRPWSP